MLLGIPFFPMLLNDQGREGGLGVISNRWAKGQTFSLAGGPLPQFLPLVWHRNTSIRKILKSVWSAYCNDLKRVSECIFFQSNKFTAWKVKDKKEVVNCLMAFNLLKIIHPFQGKKHLNIQWKLNWNPQRY